jgi:hypothetical protein
MARGRKPLGEAAMTGAERTRQYRERLGPTGPVWPAIRPWDGKTSDLRRMRGRFETETIDAIEEWVGHGDKAAVAEWLAICLGARDRDEIQEILAKVAAENA